MGTATVPKLSFRALEFNLAALSKYVGAARFFNLYCLKVRKYSATLFINGLANSSMGWPVILIFGNFAPLITALP